MDMDILAMDMVVMDTMDTMARDLLMPSQDMDMVMVMDMDMDMVDMDTMATMARDQLKQDMAMVDMAMVMDMDTVMVMDTMVKRNQMLWYFLEFSTNEVVPL